MDDSRSAPNPSARPSPFAASAPAGATRTRPGRPIQFEPFPRLTPSAPPPWIKQQSEPPSVGARMARLGVWILLALGWLVFAAWWAIVLRRESVAALTRAGGLLAIMLGVCGVGMTLWTRYNKWVARRGKRGRSSRFIATQWERDTLGRPIELPPDDEARTASDVRIVLRDGVKCYVAGGEETL